MRNVNLQPVHLYLYHVVKQTLVTTGPDSAECQPSAGPPIPLSCGEDETLVTTGPDSANVTFSRSTYTSIMWWRRNVSYYWTYSAECQPAAGPPIPLSCGEDETLVTTGPDSAKCQPPDGPPVPLSCPTGQTLVTSTEPNSASCQPAAGPPVPLSCGEDTLIINGPGSASCQPPDGPPAPLSCPTGQTLVTSTEPNSASCQPQPVHQDPLSCGEDTLIINGPGSDHVNLHRSTNTPIMSYRSNTSHFDWTQFCFMSTCSRSTGTLSCGEDTLIINGPGSASCQPAAGQPVPLSCPTGQTLVTSTEPNSASCQPQPVHHTSIMWWRYLNHKWTWFCFMSTTSRSSYTPIMWWRYLNHKWTWFCIMSTSSRSTNTPIMSYRSNTSHFDWTQFCIMSTCHRSTSTPIMWWRYLNHKWTWFCIMSTCSRSTSTPIMSYRSKLVTSTEPISASCSPATVHQYSIMWWRRRNVSHFI